MDMSAILKTEKFLILGALIAGAAFFSEHLILESGQGVSLIAGLCLIAVIIMVSLRVAHHAEVLAEKVGEPYGTMILTLSAVLVEVIILIMMLSHTSSPTLARDTIYSAVMIDMNGILGLAAILGGLRHGEQPYNVDSGNTYIVMILTGMGISMVVPEFIPSHHWQVFSVFTICSMLLLYGIFLRLQTTRHSYFFSYTYAETGDTEHKHHGSTAGSVTALVIGVILIGILAEVMAKTMDRGLTGTGVPPIVAHTGGGHLRQPGNPDRPARSAGQPDAARSQYRARRLAFHRHPDRTGDRDHGAGHRPSGADGAQRPPDRHDRAHPDRGRHKPARRRNQRHRRGHALRPVRHLRHAGGNGAISHSPVWLSRLPAFSCQGRGGLNPCNSR